MRVALPALLVLIAVPALANAQSGEPLRGDLRWGQAQRATGEEIVADSAETLASQAARLARELREVQSPSELSDRADRFARTADELARAVDSRVSPERAAIDFDDLQHDYYALRAELFAARRVRDRRRVVEEWTDVASSFERVALQLGVDHAQRCRLGPRGRSYDDDRYDDRYGYDRRNDERYGARYDDRGYDPRLDRVP